MENYVNLENMYEPCLLLKVQKKCDSHVHKQQKRIKVKSHAVIIIQKDTRDPYKVLTIQENTQEIFMEISKWYFTISNTLKELIK